MVRKSKAPDITERVIIDLTGRTSTYYEPNKNKFDIAIGNMPFIMAVTDNTPYKRQTAPFRTERYDTERDPGEHTLAGSGYWIRSQSSWHYGDGIQFTEPLEGNDNEVRFRYRDSVGIDPWTPGQISLLKKTSLVQAFRGACRISAVTDDSGTAYLIAQDFEPVITTTNTVAATAGSTVITVASTSGIVVGYKVSEPTHITAGQTVTAIGTGTITISAGTGGGTMTIGHTLTFNPVNAMYKIDSASTSWVTYSSIGNATILGSTSDGSTMFVATSDNIYDIDINTGTVHLAYVFNSQKAQRVEMKYVKSRVIAGVTFADNTVAAYELTFANKKVGASVNISTLTAINGSTTLPLRWYWDGITEAAGAIYLGGYSGNNSAVYKLTVDNTGALGTLITAATLPRGEVVTGLYGYLGTYVMIGTSKGARIAQTDQNDNLTYGPIVYHNENGVHDFEARDSYVWMSATQGVGGNSGTHRLNLAQPLTLAGYATPVYTGVYAKSSDVYAETITGKVSSVRIYGTNNLVAMAIDGSGIWIQSATDLVSSGYIRHGRIRYSTLENKAWKRLRLRTPATLAGAIDIIKVNEDTANEAFTSIPEGGNPNYDYDLASVFTDVAVDASFELVLSRNSTDATTGAVVYGLGIKALPTPTRARVLQIPLFAFDKETDKLGNMLGYEGYAHDRLALLETLESTGKTVILQDFTAGGEPTEVIIEQVTFSRTTPSARNYTGFGGIITVTARTIA